MRSVLKYGSDNGPRNQRMCEIFRCLETVVFLVLVEYVLYNSKFRLKVLAFGVQSSGEALDMGRLKRLYHVLYVPTERLSHCILLCETCKGGEIV